MSEFCKGVVNETYERYLFNTRTQADNKGIDVYSAALLRIAKNCKFSDLEQIPRERLNRRRHSGSSTSQAPVVREEADTAEMPRDGSLIRSHTRPTAITVRLSTQRCRC